MTTYKSKIGKEIILFLSPLLAGLSIFMVFMKNGPGIIIMAAVIIFIVYLFLNTYYQISENQLIVRAGFLINLKIDINSIRKIAYTQSFISAPATSIDRLEISYNKYDSVLISPLEKDEIIQHLTKLNPNIQIEK